MMTRFFASAVFAVVLALPVAGAFAQAPAGALPSSTTSSNSEGTPSGGTGVVSSTQVQGGATASTKKPVAHRATKHATKHTK